MIEGLLPLNIPPGLYRNGTLYDAKGRWRDANLVRFFQGAIRPVGGWLGGSAVSSLGVPLVMLHVVLTDFLAPTTPYGSACILMGSSGIREQDVSNIGSYRTITPSGYAGTGPATIDAFGNGAVACAAGDGRVLVWDGTASAMTVPATAPVACSAVVVTPERMVVAIGANGKPAQVAWSDQEDATTWTPTSATTAGDFTLAAAGDLVGGKRLRNETLLFTTAEAYAMRYIGGVLIYQFDQIGSGCGLVAPNAAVPIDTRAFWMSTNAFYKYDGFVREIPCPVSEAVFGNMNISAAASQVWGMTNTAFNELWWFYPSAGSSTCDKYVCYNFAEEHWTTGSLARACGIDASSTSFPYPEMMGYDDVRYSHEYLNARTGATVFLESGPIELGNGDQVMRVQHILSAENTPGTLRATFYGNMLPDGSEATYGPYTLANPTNVRLTARQVRLKFTELNANLGWRLGPTRLGVIPGGRR